MHMVPSQCQRHNCKANGERSNKKERTCVFPRWKLYAYSAAHATIFVNHIFELVRVELGGVECPLQQLDEAQTRIVQQEMHEAYEHRHNLEEVNPTLKLAFKSQPRLPIHTGSWIEDAMGNSLEIILVDAKNESPSALPANLTIELVPLLGDFPPYDNKDWSAEEFQTAIVKQRQERVPLLKWGGSRLHIRAGRVTVPNVFPKGFNIIMSDGRVTMPKELQFTDDSSWVCCRKFRIGARVRPGSDYDGSFRIFEAMTEAFVVEDLNRKHYPPVRSDPVWRLENIDKDGASHVKLTSNNIDTVQEFVSMLRIKPHNLRPIVGDTMTDKIWDMTARHAKECDPGDKVYTYSRANRTIYVDSIFGELLKIEIDGVECRLNKLEPGKALEEMSIAQQIILEAYEHRHNLQEVDAVKEELLDHTVCRIEDLLLAGTHLRLAKFASGHSLMTAFALGHRSNVSLPQDTIQLW